MEFTEPNPPEEEEQKLSRARRRRARRKIIAPLTPDEKTTYIQGVLRKAAPSFDFFLFSLFAGAVIGFGFILDSPSILVLGALLAPLMSPVIGISLGIILGSFKYFGRSVGGFLVGSFLVTLGGALAGVATRLWNPWELNQVHLHTQLSWTPFLLIGIGAIATSITLVQEKQNPGIPSTAIAYGLFVPLAASGFGLGSGIPFLWPDGVVLFSLHLAWAAIVGAITLAFMGFRPLTLFGYSIGGVVALAAIILLLGFFGFGAIFGGNVALPTSTPTLTPSLTPTLTPSPTPVPPTATSTFTVTPTYTNTPTLTFTPSPTPVEARVNANAGVVIREEPNIDSLVISRVANGGIVQLLGESEVDNFGRTWLLALDLNNDVQGWILAGLVVTATPAVTVPSATPSQTPTPTPTASNTPTPSVTPTP
jgi:hypothetical protein